MPSVSKSQHNLMAAVAHDPKFAAKVGIKQSVGQDFFNADRGRKFGKGGVMKKSEEKTESAKERAAEKHNPALEKAEGYAMGGYVAGGYAKGGRSFGKGKARVAPVPVPVPVPVVPRRPPAAMPPGAAGIGALGPGAPGPGMPGPTAAPVRPPMMKKGGTVHHKYARGGGVESKGKTKGRFV